jgi:hypothetical protein
MVFGIYPDGSMDINGVCPKELSSATAIEILVW